MEIERIGPYVIDHKIGSGGMGTVFLAQHAETRQDVAVKVLPPTLARESGFVARFEREIESLRKLVNPQIVALMDSGVDGDMYYYAMEYVEGETLTDRLRRDKRLPWRDVIGFALQICSALKSAHDAGIVHRDLKPSNLLLDKNNNIKLTDFGVAQVFAASRLTMTGGIIGTAEYMSPEQAHGRRATKKSDLYSLGAVMYTMLTGRPPFLEKSTLEVIQKHKYGTFDRPGRYVEGIPRRLEETVCQLLEKDPDKRFPDALVLSRRLDDILRRAEVADQAETRAANSNSTGNGQSGEAYLASQAPPSHDGVGGTLMRDLVRAEVEESLAGSPVAKIFDNTWVLLALFALLVGGGVVWFKMVNVPSNEVAEDQDRLDEIQYFEKAQRELKVYLRNRPLDKTDLLLRRAIHALEVGDADQAERLLLSLKSLLRKEDPEFEWPKRLQDAFTEIQKIQTLRKGKDVPQQIANDLLAQANRLEQNRQYSEARKLWRAIVDLYADDPRCQEQVSEALDRLSNPTSLEKSRSAKNPVWEKTSFFIPVPLILTKANPALCLPKSI